ncbi:MAG: PEGA domain-containing protein, partial [Candidatus Atribacteria bacterium]|nr:PEGA domain-containing protein [Candidatus Atribacteria bacterium]
IPVISPPVNYGRIVVNSNPPASKVYLDDIYRGRTPISLDTINVGYHYIKLTKPGYVDWIKKVHVYSSKTINVSADLAPLLQLGSIAISCNQGNAKIYLDGDYKKRTSSSKAVVLENVSEGYHGLSITKAGYKDWSEKVYVSSNKVTNVFVSLVKSSVDGSIVVSCNQGNAKIYLDEKFMRRTIANKSMELKNIEPGYHELLITKEGYQDWVNTIRVAANQTYVVSAFMGPETSYEGSVAVYCNVSGAKIFINGIYKAVTSSSQPKILEELRERTYEITIIKDGYRTWVEDVWVYTGDTASIYVELKEIEF